MLCRELPHCADMLWRPFQPLLIEKWGNGEKRPLNVEVINIQFSSFFVSSG